MKGVAILGCTGSIGQSALAVVDTHPDKLRVVALAAGNNASRLAEQVAKYTPSRSALAAEHGPESLIEIATHPSIDALVIQTSDGRRLEQPLVPDWISRVSVADKLVELSTLEGLIG